MIPTPYPVEVADLSPVRDLPEVLILAARVPGTGSVVYVVRDRRHGTDTPCLDLDHARSVAHAIEGGAAYVSHPLGVKFALSTPPKEAIE